MALKILEVRGYEDAKHAVDRCKSEEELQELLARCPMAKTVVDIEHELAAELLERLKARAVARALAEDV